jgi:hypothetical protein
MSDKVKPHHLARKAILYVRQSSTHQVLQDSSVGTIFPTPLPLRVGAMTMQCSGPS